MSEIKLETRIFPIASPKGNTKAFASISIENLIAIRGIRVVEGSNGLFVSMPQQKIGSGEYQDIAFPLTAELRNFISASVLDEYASSSG